MTAVPMAACYPRAAAAAASHGIDGSPDADPTVQQQVARWDHLLAIAAINSCQSRIAATPCPGAAPGPADTQSAPSKDQ